MRLKGVDGKRSTRNAGAASRARRGRSDERREEEMLEWRVVVIMSVERERERERGERKEGNGVDE